MFITNAEGRFEPVPTSPGTLQDWVNLSYKLQPIDKWLTPGLQKLGGLDVSLRGQDDDMIRDVETMSDDGKIAHMFAFNTWQFTSELWTMSAYEHVRHIKSNLGRIGATTVEMRNQWVALKRDFELIRIPLAKFRASGNSDTEIEVAHPVVPGNRGAGWQVGPNAIVWREELGEKFREAIRSLPDV
jgi:hypothetical protein